MGTSLAACGGDDPSSAPTTTAAEPPPPKPLTLELKKLSKETTEESIEVRGVVTEDARVLVNGKRAKVKGERFSISLPLDLGKNKVRVVASKPSFKKTQELAQVKREEAPVAAVDEPTATAPTETTPPTDTGPAVPGQSFEGLKYSDELPHGEPGYVLPKSERSLSCVGYDADNGECVGD